MMLVKKGDQMIEEKIKKLGFNLPATPKPVAAYIPAVKINNLVFTAGQIPTVAGELMYKGKIGQELIVEQGQRAAEICLLNGLAAIKGVTGELDKIERIVKVTAFVNSGDGFVEQPKVANGASELLLKIFDEKGKHVRSAVGVNELPLNAAVEIEIVCEVRT
jgi:enamine deaminase RidA (YjgF/YER057c/UK114 family)